MSTGIPSAERIRPQEIRVYCRSASYLDLPLLLILGFVVTETIHRKIVLREIRVDITKPACLCRATRYVFVNEKLEGLFEQNTYRCQPWESRK